jgi:hypothetical protein|uniref:Uncharacterized protein n=1 Tax=Zea mays TaxID=4577 RepID=A0A804MHS4_MAIZE
MRLDASLPTGDDPSDETASRRPSTLLNAVALRNIGTSKSAVWNSLTGHPVLPRGKTTRRGPLGTQAQRSLAWWSAGKAGITNQSQLVALHPRVYRGQQLLLYNRWKYRLQ